MDPEKGERTHWWPEILPGGKAVLFTIVTGDTIETAQVAVLSLETGEQKVLTPGSNPHYTPTGHLVYSLEGVLWAVAGVQLRTMLLLWVDRQGGSQPVTEQERYYKHARFSPNGQHVVLHVQGDEGANVWLCEIARGILTPLTFEKDNSRPIWTPDGKQITFASDRAGAKNIFWMPADGSGEAEQLTTSEHYQLPTSWSPDGKVLVFQERPGVFGSPFDIWLLPLEGERKPEPFLTTQFDERQAMFSPDGRWIAFASDRSGQEEVYVKRYPAEGGIIPISTDGGTQPVWSRSGRELFYRNVDKMMAVSIQAEPTLKVSAPRLLFEGEYSYSVPDHTSNYDISPDGQRFLMIKEGGETDEASARTELIVVQNWFEELKRLVPTGE